MKLSTKPSIHAATAGKEESFDDEYYMFHFLMESGSSLNILDENTSKQLNP